VITVRVGALMILYLTSLMEVKLIFNLGSKTVKHQILLKGRDSYRKMKLKIGRIKNRKRPVTLTLQKVLLIRKILVKLSTEASHERTFDL
jgi:hypothetical protein